MLHIQAVGDGQPFIFVSPHPESSQTKANETACVQARIQILELVGASEPAVPNSTGSLDTVEPSVAPSAYSLDIAELNDVPVVL